MQGVYSILRVVLYDLVRDEKRLVRVGSAETEHSETTRQTSDRPKKTLECLGHVMGDEVLVNLNRSID